MATTTNYGWTTPDDTSLVKDGASAIRTLGSAIDTSLNTALGTKKAGLVLLNTTTFSAVSSQSFSSSLDRTTYNQWRIEMQVYASGSTSLRLRARANTTDFTTGVYGASFYADYLAGTGIFSSSNAAAQASPAALGGNANNPTFIAFDIDLLADKSKMRLAGNAFSDDGAKSYFFGYSFDGTNINGFTFLPAAGTMTGTLSLYAYNK